MTAITTTDNMVKMSDYIMDRQNVGKVTTIRDLAKKFQTKNDAILEAIELCCVGYTVALTENTAVGLREVTLTVAEIVTPEPEAMPEGGYTYIVYADAEAASTVYPEGFVSIKQLREIFEASGIAINRLLQAMGGDKGAYAPRNVNWKIFKIKGDRNRWVSQKALQDIDAIATKKGK